MVKNNLSGKNAVFSLNQKPINLAGVVGDMSTSCSTETKTVLVECAYFQPEAVVGKSVKYDIQSAIINLKEERSKLSGKSLEDLLKLLAIIPI